MQIKKMPNLCSSNGKKAWHTLSIIYSINPRGCPPLVTTSLGQVVDCLWMIQMIMFWNMEKIREILRKRHHDYHFKSFRDQRTGAKNDIICHSLT